MYNSLNEIKYIEEKCKFEGKSGAYRRGLWQRVNQFILLRN